MDYSQSDEVKILKRSDTIYKEIESFEEYEITQCVAYEMAMRNKEISELFIKSHLANAKVQDGSFIDILFEDKEDGEKREALKKLHDLGFNISEIVDYNTKRFSTNNKTFKGEGILYTPEETKIKDILNEDELKKIFEIESEEWNKDNPTDEADDIHIKSYENFISFYDVIEEPMHEKSKEVLRKALKRNNRITAKNDFSRPIIQPSYTPICNININLTLPDNELIEYIKLLKKHYTIYNAYSNTETGTIHLKPNTPLEFLGEELQQAQPTKNYPKKPNAEKYADMFFIYDYVTKRYKEVKQWNAEQKEEYEAELLTIKHNADLSTKEKRGQTKQALKHYKEMKSDATLKDICYEYELTEQLDIQGEMIYKNYRIMKPYIEEMKYKELITGIQAK